MPQDRSNKARTPLNADAFNLVPDLATMADTMGVIVPVANRTEADAVATQRGADGWPVSDARPLFVFRADTKGVEVKDSSGWRGAGAMRRHMEFINSSFSVTGGYVSWDVGPLTIDAAKTVNGGFATTSGTNGTFNIAETGDYSIHMYTCPISASAGIASSFIRINGNPITAVNTSGFPNWEAPCGVPRIRLTAGDAIMCVLIAQTTRNWTTRVYIDKLDN